MSVKAKFEQGARVGLKSGGPVMTVTEVVGKENIEVVWFDTVNQLQEATFPRRILNLLEADEDYKSMIEIQRIQRQLQIEQMNGQLAAVKANKAGLVRAMPQA